MPRILELLLDLRAAATARPVASKRRSRRVAGTEAVYPIRAEDLGGATDALHLATLGLPTGAIPSFDVETINPGGSTNLRIGTAGVLSGLHKFRLVATPEPAGNVIWAASPAFADVQAATNAAAYEQTVRIPAGSASWPSALNPGKAVNLVGAGIGQTIITTSAGLLNYTADAYTKANGLVLRVSGLTHAGSGITFRCYDYGTPITWVAIGNIRCAAGQPINVKGHVFGVMYACQFAGITSFQFLGNHNASYDEFYPSVYGTIEQFYVEDCSFESDYTGETYVNSGHGGRYSFRYNTGSIYRMGNPMFDQHGNQDGGIRALMICEIYENTFSGFQAGVARFNYQRGGKLLLFNNTLAGSGGSPNITCHDDTADAYHSTACEHPHQVYVWNNKWNGTRINGEQGSTQTYGSAGPDCDGGVTPNENRHYWNQNDSFNGSVGIGVGLLSARPSSGLVAGVGYWATDTKTLYRATGPTTWETYYTPYTYPHPLRGD